LVVGTKGADRGKRSFHADPSYQGKALTSPIHHTPHQTTQSAPNNKPCNKQYVNYLLHTNPHLHLAIYCNKSLKLHLPCPSITSSDSPEEFALKLLTAAVYISPNRAETNPYIHLHDRPHHGMTLVPRDFAGVGARTRSRVEGASKFGEDQTWNEDSS
jgi:hypothetical protein